MTLSMHKTPGIVLEKLGRLLKVLQTSKKVYEQTAFEVPDSQVRIALLGHAQEYNQYARELASQIEVLGGESAETSGASPSPQPVAGEVGSKEGENSSTTKMAMNHCTKNGTSTLQAYSEVLSEPSLNESIRKLIRYQVDGLLHSLAQLYLLSSSLA